MVQRVTIFLLPAGHQPLVRTLTMAELSEAEVALLAGEGEAFLEHSHRLLEKYRKKENDESDNISSKL